MIRASHPTGGTVTALKSGPGDHARHRKYPGSPELSDPELPPRLIGSRAATPNLFEVHSVSPKQNPSESAMLSDHVVRAQLTPK